MRIFSTLICVAGIVTGCDGNWNVCDELSSRLVARSYVLTMPLMGRDKEMIPLMASYPDHFERRGGAIRCMKRLGEALVEGSIAQSREYSGYSATERFGSMMPPSLAGLPSQVDSSMRSYGSEMFTMGEELIWLSEVLPAAAQGNYAPYNESATTTRQTAKQVVPLYQLLCQLQPSVCQAMFKMFHELEPLMEQQVYALAQQTAGPLTLIRRAFDT